MPQLDLITFFPQFIWSFLLYFSFYFYFLFKIIPKLATVLKFRKHKLLLLANNINKTKDGSTNLLVEYDKIIKTSCQELVYLFQELLQKGNTWVVSSNSNMQTKNLWTCNKIFFNNIFAKESINYKLNNFVDKYSI